MKKNFKHSARTTMAHATGAHHMAATTADSDGEIR